jgi:hypothetical protein
LCSDIPKIDKVRASITNGVWVMHTGFLKLITHPVAGLTLFTLMVVFRPISARLPKLPCGISGQQQIAYILGGGDRLFLQDAILQEGNTVIVPKTTERPIAEAVKLVRVSFLSDKINVSLVREIKTPETIKVTPNTTLNQVLTAGSSQDSRARQSNVDLIRRLNLDGISRQPVPINLAKSVNDKSNPILSENEIIVISRSGTTRIVDTLSLLFNPAASVLTVLQLLGIK